MVEHGCGSISNINITASSTPHGNVQSIHPRHQTNGVLAFKFIEWNRRVRIPTWLLAHRQASTNNANKKFVLSMKLLDKQMLECEWFMARRICSNCDLMTGFSWPICRPIFFFVHSLSCPSTRMHHARLVQCTSKIDRTKMNCARGYKNDYQIKCDAPSTFKSVVLQARVREQHKLNAFFFSFDILSFASVFFRFICEDNNNKYLTALIL